MTLEADVRGRRPQVCCDPCPIPEKDLTATLLYDSCVPATVPLVHTPGTGGLPDQWISAWTVICAAWTVRLTFWCENGRHVLRIESSEYDCDGRFDPYPALEDSHDCEPLHVEFMMPAFPPNGFGPDCDRFRYYTGLKQILIDE